MHIHTFFWKFDDLHLSAPQNLMTDIGLNLEHAVQFSTILNWLKNILWN